MLRGQSLRSPSLAVSYIVRFAVLAAAMLAMPLAAQTATPVILPEAVSIALEKNPLHKAAMANWCSMMAFLRKFGVKPAGGV